MSTFKRSFYEIRVYVGLPISHWIIVMKVMKNLTVTVNFNEYGLFLQLPVLITKYNRRKLTKVPYFKITHNNNVSVQGCLYRVSIAFIYRKLFNS